MLRYSVAKQRKLGKTVMAVADTTTMLAYDDEGAGTPVVFFHGLTFDRHQEEQNVGVFTRALRSSIEEFLDDPLGAPLVPNWARVWAGVPDAGARLMSAVQEGQGDLHTVGLRNGG